MNVRTPALQRGDVLSLWGQVVLGAVKQPTYDKKKGRGKAHVGGRSSLVEMWTVTVIRKDGETIQFIVASEAQHTIERGNAEAIALANKEEEGVEMPAGIHLNLAGASVETIQAVKRLLVAHPGETEVYVWEGLTSDRPSSRGSEVRSSGSDL